MLLSKNNIIVGAAGIIYGIAFMMVVDSVVIAQQEAEEGNRFSFIMSVPAVFSTVGAFVHFLVSPVDIREGKAKAKASLFFGWACMLASTVASLFIVSQAFCGSQARARASPGVDVACYTALVPIASSLLWWSRGEDNDDDW